MIQPKHYLPGFLCTLIFSFCLSSSFGQNKWEPLEASLADSTDKGKIAFYTTAGKSLFVSNRKQSELYVRKAFEIAEKSSDFKAEQADLNNFLGILLMYSKAYDDADRHYQKSISIARQIDNRLVEIKARTNIALNSSLRGDFQKAVAQNFDLLNLLGNGPEDPLILSNLYANLSNAYYYLGQLDPAEKYQLKALGFFRKVKNESGVANALNTLGTIYTDKKNYAKSASYLKQSLAIKNKLGDSLGVANTWLNLTTLYYKLKNDKAELYAAEQAEKYYAALNDEEKLASVYINRGSYYSRHDDWAKAAQYEKKAINIAEKTKNAYLLSNAYENMSGTYAHLKSPDTALAFSNKALQAKDSMYDVDMRKHIADVEVKFETAQKEKQIKEQELELQQNDNALMKRNYTIGAISVLLLIALLVGYLLYKRNKLQLALSLQQEIMKQQDLATTAVMEAEENERVRIARELHDGIGQMMSVAKMNLSAMEPSLSLKEPEKMQFEKAIALVDESCKEVRMVAHTMMPNALLKAGLANAIKDFINKIDNRVLKINFASEGMNERMDYKTETVLYRVVQESVHNVIKHSGANELDIALIKDVDGISVTIEDNGNGFIEKLAMQSEGIGLKNIRTRVAYLQGTVEWSTRQGEGTLVAIHIPNKNTYAGE